MSFDRRMLGVVSKGGGKTLMKLIRPQLVPENKIETRDHYPAWGWKIWDDLFNADLFIVEEGTQARYPTLVYRIHRARQRKGGKIMVGDGWEVTGDPFNGYVFRSLRRQGEFMEFPEWLDWVLSILVLPEPETPASGT